MGQVTTWTEANIALQHKAWPLPSPHFRGAKNHMSFARPSTHNGFFPITRSVAEAGWQSP